MSNYVPLGDFFDVMRATHKWANDWCGTVPDISKADIDTVGNLIQQLENIWGFKTTFILRENEEPTKE